MKYLKLKLRVPPICNAANPSPTNIIVVVAAILLCCVFYRGCHKTQTAVYYNNIRERTDGVAVFCGCRQNTLIASCYRSNYIHKLHRIMISMCRVKSQYINYYTKTSVRPRSFVLCVVRTLSRTTAAVLPHKRRAAVAPRDNYTSVHAVTDVTRDIIGRIVGTKQ